MLRRKIKTPAVKRKIQTPTREQLLVQNRRLKTQLEHERNYNDISTAFQEDCFAKILERLGLIEFRLAKLEPPVHQGRAVPDAVLDQMDLGDRYGVQPIFDSL